MRALARVAVVLPALVACLGEKIPTRQVGGTEFDMPLAVPSPVRLPTLAVTVSSRTSPVIDSITVTASFLKPLTSPAAYQLYLVDSAGAARPIRGIITTTRTDSIVGPGGITTTTTTSPPETTSVYRGAPFNTVATIKIKPLGAGSPDTIGRSAQFLVLTIQTDAESPSYGAATPKPLWFRLRQASGAPAASGDATFGTFNSPSDTRRYSAQGTGRAALWDRGADGMLVFSALVTGLPQPPVGYIYQPWVRDSRTGRVTRFGELREAVSDSSLANADLAPPVGTFAQLPRARFRTTEQELSAEFTDYTSVQLVLEPKLGDPSFPNAAVALQGNIPQILTDRRAKAGVISARVLRGSDPVASAVVAVYGDGTSTVIGSQATDATGTAVVGGVPAGTVDVRIFPPSGYTAPEPVQRGVRVVSGDTTRVTFILQ